MNTTDIFKDRTMLLKTMLVILVTGLGSTVAQGALLHTGYIERDGRAAGFSLVCGATNVTNEPLTARMELMGFNGNVVSASRVFNVAPGATVTRSTGNSLSAPEAAGCRFFLKGNQSNWRANGCIFDNAANICVSTVEAR